jgi:hypothetical protein
LENIIGLIKNLNLSIEVVNDNPNYYSISFFKDNFEYCVDKFNNEYVLTTPYGQTFTGSEKYIMDKIKSLIKK